MKKIESKTYYNDYPAWLYKIAYEDNLYVYIYILEKGITEITLDVNGEVITHSVNENENNLKIKIESDKSFYNNLIKIISVKQNNNILKTEDYEEKRFTRLNEVYSIKKYRKFYQNEASKLISGLKPSDSKFIFKQFNSYYGCTCGMYNLEPIDECLNCKAKKEQLKALNKAYEDEKDKTNYLFKTNIQILIIAALVYILDIVLGSMTHYIYYNELMSTAIPVFIRIFTPVFLLAFVAINLYFIKTKRKLASIITTILSLSIILIHNILMLSSAVKYSYLLVLVIGYDLLLIYIIIRYFKKYNKLYAIIPSISLASILIISLSFTNYNIRYQNNMWILKVKENENITEYKSVSYINNVEVDAIEFDGYTFDKINSVTLSETIKKVILPNNSYLPNLKSIIIDENNKYLTLTDNVVYNDNEIVLLPVSNKEIVLKEGVKKIDYKQFANCDKLETIVIPSSVETIERKAFENCTNLKTIIFNEGKLKNINEEAFKACTSLKEITLPVSLKNLGKGILQDCNSLETLITPFIGQTRTDSSFLCYMFGGAMYLDANYIPNSLKNIEIYDQTTLYNVAFLNCKSIEKVMLHNSFKNWNVRVFEGCTNLKEVTIPNTIRLIGRDSFKGCDNLTKVNYDGNINELEIAYGNEKLLNCLN